MVLVRGYLVNIEIIGVEIVTDVFIRFLFKDSQLFCYKKFVKNSTDLLVS